MKVLIDANVILRLMVPEKKSFEQHLQAKRLWKEISDNQIDAVISVSVIQEVLWVAESVYQLKRGRCSRDLMTLCEYKNIEILELSKQLFFSLLFEFEKNNVDFTDVYLSIISKEKNLQVASFDKDLEKIEAPLYKWK